MFFMKKRKQKQEKDKIQENSFKKIKIIGLTKKQKLFLINLARDAIAHFVSSDLREIENYTENIKEQIIKMKKIDKEFYNILNSYWGIFTTLKTRGKPEKENLRGCIGIIKPIYPLYQAIIKTAISAAFEDIRFYKFAEKELPKTYIEISLLTKPKIIRAKTLEEYEKEILLGDDGLILESQFGSGLLLPQVFDEWNIVKVKDALSMLTQKAGLPGNGWKYSKIYKFQAEIINEKDLK